MRTIIVAATLALTLSGCMTAGDKAKLNDAVFVNDYNTCAREVGWFGTIPDFGITQELHFFKCMELAGWVQTPRWNPRALERFERVK